MYIQEEPRIKGLFWFIPNSDTQMFTSEKKTIGKPWSKVQKAHRLGLVAGVHGCCGTGRVGGLGVGVVRFHQRSPGHPVPNRRTKRSNECEALISVSPPQQMYDG